VIEAKNAVVMSEEPAIRLQPSEGVLSRRGLARCLSPTRLAYSRNFPDSLDAIHDKSRFYLFAGGVRPTGTAGTQRVSSILQKIQIGDMFCIAVADWNRV